jgi:hypothetical protein
LPDDLLAKIQCAAKKTGETKSAVMREALEEFLTKDQNLRTSSCLEYASDLAGCVKGPPDLSTNPDKFKNYGI